MFAAIEDVHHRHGEDLGGGAAEVAVEGEVGGFGGGFGDGHGDAEDGVGAEFGFVVGAVELDHQGVDFFLVAGVEAEDFGGDFFVDVVDGLEGALAAVALGIAIAQFAGFVFAGGSAGGDTGGLERRWRGRHRLRRWDYRGNRGFHVHGLLRWQNSCVLQNEESSPMGPERSPKRYSIFDCSATAAGAKNCPFTA